MLVTIRWFVALISFRRRSWSSVRPQGVQATAQRHLSPKNEHAVARDQKPAPRSIFVSSTGIYY